MAMDLYQIVTDKILAQLEKGTAPWVKPWSGKDCEMPHNAITGKAYRGINAWLLYAPNGATGDGWMTYKQAQSVGANVKKGEKGSMIVFYKPWVMTDKNATPRADGKDVTRSIPLLRCFTVFHTSQIENLPGKYLPVNVVHEPMPIASVSEAAEGLLKQATIEHTGARAFYSPSVDKIQLPAASAFNSIPEYYAVALHELVHWSGAKNRLAREYGKRFGDTAYAREELVAEMGAAYLCAACGIDGQLQHAQYLASWIKVLKEDKRAIVMAAGAAQKAADFITGKPAYVAEAQESEEVAA